MYDESGHLRKDKVSPGPKHHANDTNRWNGVEATFNKDTKYGWVLAPAILYSGQSSWYPVGR
jgi:hypothetical protein